MFLGRLGSVVSKTVMGILYLWRSIQLKALHAELLGRRLQANAKRMRPRWSILHPGRFVFARSNICVGSWWGAF
jgi:hypothetical protein